MDKGKDARTTFRIKRGENVESLKEKLRESQQAYETICESTTPTRTRTLLILVDKDEPVDILSEVAVEYGCRLEIVHNEFDLFHEIGKNSVVGIIVQARKSKQPVSTISSLMERDIPTFVICRETFPELDLWLKAYKEVYKWPDEIGRLVCDIKNLCHCE